MANNSNRIARIVRQRRKRRSARQNRAPQIGRMLGCGLLTFIVTLVVVTAITAGTSVGVYAYYARELPPADSIVSAQQDAFQTTIFYDSSGKFAIYEVIDPFGGDRQYATVDEVPDYFLDATVAIEDKSFYENPGFDIRGMSRAVWSNLSGGELQQGGSTITQQLVKNTLIPPDERTAISVDRKMKEIILANELARLYSKEQILEWYINTNFYGNLAYGVEAASRVYFDKPASDLTLAESAVLAAIPQSPQKNPINNDVAARERQKLVLDRMVEQNYITQAEANAAFAETLVIKPFSQRFNITAPHFSLYARDEAQAILDDLDYDGARLISQGGLRITTTLDLDLQQQAECTARSHVDRLASGNPTFTHNTSAGTDCVAVQYLKQPSQAISAQPRTVTNTSVVILNARTGEIVTMMGSVDFWDSTIDGNFNGVLAQRQPASTFKPFVYGAAFFRQLDAYTVVSPATMTYDVYTEFDNGQPEPYVPLNIDRQFHGPVSVRKALANSYNVPAVQVISWIGLTPVLDMARTMGINSIDENLSAHGLALSLGTAEASLMDMTFAYNTFNNLGTMVGTPVSANEARSRYRQLNPTSIKRIEDANGDILWEYGKAGTFDSRTVLEPGIAYLITDILADSEARLDAFPRGSALELGRPAAVKTGTSDDFRDSWTIGYTPQYTAGVWVGNNNNDPMEDISGSVGAAPIWNAIMEYIHNRDQIEVEEWAQPNTVTAQNVCQWSGLLPTSDCPQYTEVFYLDSVLGIDYRPNLPDNYWVRLSVNTCNGKLSTAYTPAECLADRTYFDPPDELREWAITSGLIDLPPTEYDESGTSSPFDAVVISSPSFLQNVNGTVEITGNVSDDNMSYFYLEIGQGSVPETWQRIGDNQDVGGNGLVLGSWDTTTVPDDLYILRLTMVRSDATLEPDNREIIVDNTPPSVRLVEPLTTKIYSRARDVFIEIVAEARDNRQIDTVEFYVDDVLVSPQTESPYTYRWTITDSTSVEMWAIVYDAAGNKTESERITVNLEP